MLVIGLECHCVWCKEERSMRNDIYGNTEVRNRLRQVDRDFMAKMIRIGRNSGVPNKRMMVKKLSFQEFFGEIFGNGK